MSEGDTFLSVVVGLKQDSGKLRNEVELQISSVSISTTEGGKCRVQYRYYFFGRDIPLKLCICITTRLQHTHDASDNKLNYSKQDNQH